MSLKDKLVSIAIVLAVILSIIALTKSGNDGEDGKDGNPGPQGDLGVTGVITHTLSASEEATASIDLVNGERILNLGIPAGQTGSKGNPGEPGEPGEPGPEGKTPFTEIGQVTTLPSGSVASAQIIDGKLYLWLPEGAEGPTGDQGPRGQTGMTGARGATGVMGPPGPNATNALTISSITPNKEGEYPEIGSANSGSMIYLSISGRPSGEEIVFKMGGKFLGRATVRSYQATEKLLAIIPSTLPTGHNYTVEALSGYLRVATCSLKIN